jgi:hypothetical protein
MPTDDLAQRLTALEDRVPVRGDLPSISVRRHGQGHARVAVLVAVALLLPVAVASADRISSLVRGYPGVENKGQPLYGADLECMSPPAAATYLARHGFDDVIWQVESGTGKTGHSVQRRSAPAHGFVVPGSVMPDGSLIMVVDQRTGATGTGACPDMRMP